MTETSNAWSLVSYRSPGRPGIRAGVLLSDGVLLAPSELDPYSGVVSVTEDWERASEVLRSLSPQTPRVASWSLDIPLRYPRKILCSGPNFTDHLAEMGESFGARWHPYFFLKPPTTSLVGDGEPILISGDPADRVDWEGELGVVIGVGGRDIPVEDASGHVAGYTVLNDISLRGPHRREEAPAPFVWDWLASKGADTSLPIASGVVPSWKVEDPQRLVIETRVNGKVMQSASTSLMVCTVPELVSAASRLTTLEPGDLIATGTPAGVGVSTGTFLRDGDVVEVSIQGIGRVSNPVRTRPRGGSTRHA